MKTLQRGISLIEMSIAVAISTIAAATAVPSFQNLLETQRLTGTAAELASDVQLARSQTVLRNEALRLSFYVESWGTCYVVHSGAREQCHCVTGAPAVCEAGVVQIKSVTLPGSGRIGVSANVGSILFDPLHGTGTPTGTLKVQMPSGRAIHHVVNVMGRVRSCSPDSPAAVVSGFRPC